MAAGDTPITIVGNACSDPDLRYTQSGAAVANLTVASTPRTFDKQSGQYVDGDALFLKCNIWRDMAEHTAESVSKGQRVIVTGRLKARNWEDKEGNKRVSYEVDVDEIGPSLKWATAQVTKAQRQTSSSAPARDPWDAPSQPVDDSPPF